MYRQKEDNIKNAHKNSALIKKKHEIAKKMHKIDWSKADSMRAKPNPNYFKG
jgi:hypothetical protein